MLNIIRLYGLVYIVLTLASYLFIEVFDIVEPGEEFIHSFAVGGAITLALCGRHLYNLDRLDIPLSEASLFVYDIQRYSVDFTKQEVIDKIKENFPEAVIVKEPSEASEKYRMRFSSGDQSLTIDIYEKFGNTMVRISNRNKFGTAKVNWDTGENEFDKIKRVFGDKVLKSEYIQHPAIF